MGHAGQSGGGRNLANYQGTNREQKQALREEAYQLRLSGWTYTQIAKKMKISDKTARQWCLLVISRIEVENGEQLAKFELDRLDRLQVKAMAVIAMAEERLRKETDANEGYASEKTLKIHLDANARLQSISESRRKLLGLDAAEKHEIENKKPESEAESALLKMVDEWRKRNAEEMEHMRDNQA